MHATPFLRVANPSIKHFFVVAGMWFLHVFFFVVGLACSNAIGNAHTFKVITFLYLFKYFIKFIRKNHLRYEVISEAVFFKYEHFFLIAITPDILGYRGHARFLISGP